MSWRSMAGLALGAFALGGGAVGWAIYDGLLPWNSTPKTISEDALTKSSAQAPAPIVNNPVESNPAPTPPITPPTAPIQPPQSNAIFGINRTQALYQVQNARQRLMAGQPLGELAAQMESSFGQTQPQALDAFRAAAQKPVTPAMLLEELNRIAPSLKTAQKSGWQRIESELSSLFVLRSSNQAVNKVDQQYTKAQGALLNGDVETAMSLVRTMPGANSGASWLDMARRHVEMKRSLDRLEQAALSAPPPAPILLPDQIPGMQ